MRRAGIVGIITALWLLSAATPAAAHGLGGGLDLPMPMSYFVVATGVFLALVFSVLAVTWPAARRQSASPGRVLGTGWRWVIIVLMAAGVALYVLVVAAGVFGDDRRTNAAPPVVWVYFWLVLPLVGAVVGDLWRYLNPWRTLAGDRRRAAFPAATGEGLYPAAIAFVVFAWLALVPSYSREPGVLGLAAVVYGIYLGAAVVVGDRERAFGSFDAFTPYNYLIGAIAPLELDASGTWRWHGWLRRLPTVPVWRGLPLFVAAMLGAVVYDGLSGSALWDDQWGTTRFEEWFATLALLATIGVIGAAYWAACWVAARTAGTMTTGQVAGAFAHILVPIGLAYAVAHYFTVIAFEGQIIVAVASDPLGVGSDYFGTALHEVKLWIGATAVWYLQLGVIVAGHGAALVLAHDRAVASFPQDRAVRSQYGMLAFVVALSAVGLAVLTVA